MTVIVYFRTCGKGLVQVLLSHSEENLEIARKEAWDGTYTLKEVDDLGVC